MSYMFDSFSLQQESAANGPAEAQLNGKETLDDFVRMIRIREKSKRHQLPALDSGELPPPTPRPILQRFRETLLCM